MDTIMEPQDKAKDEADIKGFIEDWRQLSADERQQVRGFMAGVRMINVTQIVQDITAR